tara:strand:+ start:15676 stop:16509 length:834 start_codon:yes stop_codon:yes gene_type:complete
MAKNNELAIVDPKEYAMLKVAPDRVASLLRANLGDDEEISERDLTRVGFPSGKVAVFEIETEDGTETPQEIQGIILYAGSRRALWGDPYGTSAEKTPPICSSIDAKVGVGYLTKEEAAAAAEKPGGSIPQRLCKTCPKAQFGSGVDEKGEPTKGQACQQRKLLFLAVPDRAMPIVLSLPPTSIAAHKAYGMKLASVGKDIRSVVTKISLKKDKNDKGIEYAIAEFSKVRDVDDAMMEQVVSLAENLSEVFRSVGITEDERPQGATVHGEVIDGETVP